MSADSATSDLPPNFDPAPRTPPTLAYFYEGVTVTLGVLMACVYGLDVVFIVTITVGYLHEVLHAAVMWCFGWKYRIKMKVSLRAAFGITSGRCDGKANGTAIRKKLVLVLLAPQLILVVLGVLAAHHICVLPCLVIAIFHTIASTPDIRAAYHLLVR